MEYNAIVFKRGEAHVLALPAIPSLNDEREVWVKRQFDVDQNIADAIPVEVNQSNLTAVFSEIFGIWNNAGSFMSWLQQELNYMRNQKIYNITKHKVEIIHNPIPCPDGIEGCEVLHIKKTAKLVKHKSKPE